MKPNGLCETEETLKTEITAAAYLVDDVEEQRADDGARIELES